MRPIDQDEELRILATSLAMDAGAIRECDRHEGIYILRDSSALETAYERAEAQLRGSELTFSIEEVREAIKSVVADAVDRCGVGEPH